MASKVKIHSNFFLPCDGFKFVNLLVVPYNSVGIALQIILLFLLFSCRINIVLYFLAPILYLLFCFFFGTNTFVPRVFQKQPLSP